MTNNPPTKLDNTDKWALRHLERIQPLMMSLDAFMEQTVPAELHLDVAMALMIWRLTLEPNQNARAIKFFTKFIADLKHDEADNAAVE